MAEPPKLIIDSDWKSQAQAEKEKLAAQERERAAKQQQQAQAGFPGSAAGGMAAGGGVGAGGGPDDRMPEASFDELIRMFILPTLTYLGAFPDPETGRAVVALDVAKLHIDLLALLETKTKGNLTADESSALTRVLHELRLQFVETSKAVAKAMQEGRVSRGGGPGGFAGGGVMPATGPIPPAAPASPGIPNLRFPST